MPHTTGGQMAIKKPSQAQQRGMSFIEVLVALVILVTGIFGAVAMQAAAKKGSFDAMQRSLASSLAQDIIERMRSNDSSVNNTPSTNVLANYKGDNYGALGLSAPSPRCNSIANLCSSVERVANDRYEWEQALIGADVKNGSANVGGLVDARGCIAVNGNAVTVAVSWLGRTDIADGAAGDVIECGTSGDARRQILIQAFIF